MVSLAWRGLWKRATESSTICAHVLRSFWRLVSLVGMLERADCLCRRFGIVPALWQSQFLNWRKRHGAWHRQMCHWPGVELILTGCKDHTLWQISIIHVFGQEWLAVIRLLCHSRFRANLLVVHLKRVPVSRLSFKIALGLHLLLTAFKKVFQFLAIDQTSLYYLIKILREKLIARSKIIAEPALTVDSIASGHFNLKVTKYLLYDLLILYHEVFLIKELHLVVF